MMAKNSEFEEEMRKSDTAAYRAGLADEPGTESTAAFMKRTGTKATRPKATVGGPKIVTKEQMKKKGFDNLRDYLNAERNLKRRDNFASEAQKRLFATGARGTQTEGSAGEAEARAVAEMRRKAKMPGSKEDMERDAREQAISGGMKKGGKVESKLMGKEGRGMAKATMQKVASKAVKGHESRMHKMKSGGTVSSASKRADGIAMKGKTRGRMV
jgi:hypothetical protein